MTTELQRIVADWQPEPLDETRIIQPEESRGFARLLDQSDPVGAGGEIPPLWHWFSFTPRHSTAELGDDGHPRAGRFLPPMPNRRRMLGGGRLDVTHPFHVGERYARRTSLDQARVKHGRSGDMIVVRIRHEYTHTDGLVAVEHEDTVYRSQAPGEERHLAPPAVEAVTTPQPHELRLSTNELSLFRFSALTNNAHRIHYDHRYVTSVEGYPDLVVHGPLLALAMLEPSRRADMTVGAFEFRFRAPMFVGSTLVVNAAPQAEEHGQAAVSVTSTEDPTRFAAGTVTFGQSSRQSKR